MFGRNKALAERLQKKGPERETPEATAKKKKLGWRIRFPLREVNYK